MTNTTESDYEGIFEERAEHLSREELLSWSAAFPRDAEIQRTLTGIGAKLLIGPRGSGKSTHLRRAYFSMLDEGSVLPIYVNYSRSLALEPLFHRSANALALFRQWVLMKIIQGAANTLADLGEDDDDLQARSKAANKFIGRLEAGEEPPLPSDSLGPSALQSLIEQWVTAVGRRRCVLLLDDAAHAFSLEQQREFFEIYRELRSRHVAPKAAVYPGITEYSPYFNIGHDGDLVEVWADLDAPGHAEAMQAIIKQRLPAEFASRLDRSPDTVEALVYASFGLPRSFLNMIADVLQVDGSQGGSVTWSKARDAIRRTAAETISVFESLGTKVARFRLFIEGGNEFLGAITKYLRTFNTDRSTRRKAVAVGLRTPLSSELQKVLGFLEYAGLVRQQSGPVSRGEKGKFRLYTIHYAVLFSENSFALGKRGGGPATAEALRHRDAHAFPKLTPSTLVGDDFDQRCVIELPACAECGAERTLPDARFCPNCGAELSDTSIYEAAMNCSVDALGITSAKKEGLKQIGLDLVKHVILADPSAIRSIKGVGEVWAARIKTAAEEYVSV